MKRSIILSGQRIEYDLQTRKTSKSIRVKVVFGKLKVSAPTYVPIHEIESFIKKNEQTLLDEIEASSLADYQDGGYVYILGYRCKIVLRDMGIHKCVIKDHIIYVYHSNIQKEIETYLQNSLQEYIQNYIHHFIKKYHNFPDPVITYKRTTGRYGACYYTQNKVCFNPLLIHYKKTFIDSVIIHEMCHFKYHDHSNHFYLECEKYMKDYIKISKGKKVYD